MHIRAETYKHRFEFKAFKTVNSIIVKWKKFGTTRTLSTAGSPAKLSNWCVCVCVCLCVCVCVCVCAGSCVEIIATLIS